MPIFDKERRFQRRADRLARRFANNNEKRRKNGFKVDRVVSRTEKVRDLKQRARSVQTENVQLQGRGQPQTLQLTGRVAGLPDQVAELAETVAEQAEAIAALQEQLDEQAASYEEALTEMAVEVDEREMKVNSMWAQAGIILETLIGAINTGDVVQIPVAVSGSEAIEGYANTQLAAQSITAEEHNRWMLGAAALKAIGYFDAQQGLISILQSDSGSLLNLGTGPSTGTATLIL